MMKKKVKWGNRRHIQVGEDIVTMVDADKSYPQFDSALPSIEQRVYNLKKYINDPQLVTQHQFLPVVLRQKIF